MQLVTAVQCVEQPPLRLTQEDCQVQIEVLVEIGANSLERKQLTDKYTPLAVLEAAKYVLDANNLANAGSFGC